MLKIYHSERNTLDSSNQIVTAFCCRYSSILPYANIDITYFFEKKEKDKKVKKH